MTRVFGQLFPDGRDGTLAITASKPFLGAERDETHYPVVDGAIDIELLPTPRGIVYNVGFKRTGDTRRSIFTTRWVVPSTGELDVTPTANKQPQSSSMPVFERVQTKRLADELQKAINAGDTKDKQFHELQAREQALRQELDQFKQTSEQLLNESHRQFLALEEKALQPEIKTIVKRVPVLPAPLEERIKRLEAENTRLTKLNDHYSELLLELNQLKLDRAQPEIIPEPVIEVPGTPQQRLFQKLQAK